MRKMGTSRISNNFFSKLEIRGKFCRRRTFSASCIQRTSFAGENSVPYDASSLSNGLFTMSLRLRPGTKRNASGKILVSR
jgi:hypothetical protein